MLLAGATVALLLHRHPPRPWWRGDDGLLARAAALSLTACLALGLFLELSHLLLRRTHDPELGAAALTVLATALAVGVALGRGAVAAALAPRMGRLAGWSRVALPVVAPAALAVALLSLAGWSRVPWGPLAGLAVAGAVGLAVGIRCRPELRRLARVGAASGAALIVALVLALVASSPAVRRISVAKTWFAGPVVRGALGLLLPAPGGGGADVDPAAALAAAARPAYRVGDPLTRPDWNVLLVTVDALRVDRLGAKGPGGQALAPRLDALAGRAWRFERAYAPATTTRYSVGALLQGRAASSVAWLPTPDGWLRPDPGAGRSLAAALAGAGLRTAAVVPGYAAFLPGAGLDAGFARVHVVPVSTPRRVTGEETSAATTQAALEALAALAPAAGRGWLLWVHYLDPHGPYRAHADTPAPGDGVPDRYDAEVAHTDRHLGVLLDALAGRADAARTIVAVTSDHGEQLGERGVMGSHGYEVTEEEAAVPLLLAIPGAPPLRLATPVSTADLPVTLLNLLGVRDDPFWSQAEGRNLLDVVRDQPGAAAAPVFLEAWTLRGYAARRVAVVDGTHKAVLDGRSRTVSLFDLAADPGETTDLAGRMLPAEERRLRGLLTAWLTAHPLPRRP